MICNITGSISVLQGFRVTGHRALAGASRAENPSSNNYAAVHRLACRVHTMYPSLGQTFQLLFRDWDV
jgi:hypothetical protein